MSTGLKFGFMTLPRSADEVRAVAVDAERAGWHWMGVADSPAVYQESYLHQLEALRVTERLAVGPMVSHVVVRHPLVVGNLLATLHELGGGRAIGTIGTGNSAARGLGLAPATVAELDEAVAAIRGYWSGAGGSYRGSRIPATHIERPACPIFIAADGPKATALAARVGDGLLYGGTMDPAVLERRAAAGRTRPDQELWAAPAVSLAETVEDVLADMGAMAVAMANRAFRGDLHERGVPERLHADIREMWRRYDYAHHADNTRPENVRRISPALAAYLVEHFVIWGDERRWAAKLDLLRASGFHGVHFILGQGGQRHLVSALSDRLRALGELAA